MQQCAVASVLPRVTTYDQDIARSTHLLIQFFGNEHKTQGIMRDLGLDGWGLLARDLSAGSLLALFGKLEEHRSDYRAHLDHVIPGYVARGRATADALARACNRGPAAAENENAVISSRAGYEEDCHMCRESVLA